MAHWAEVNENNVVLRVLVTTNEGDEGLSWLENTLGGRWIKTSYNAKENGFRKNFASPGFIYDDEIDAFIPLKPFNSWILNQETAQWESPIALPNDGKNYVWEEETTSWIEVLE